MATRPWLRLDAAYYLDARVRKCRAGAIWPWVLCVLKRHGGFAPDEELDAELCAVDLALDDADVVARLAALKRTGLLIYGETEINVGGRGGGKLRVVRGWTTETWADYQPDERVGIGPVRRLSPPETSTGEVYDLLSRGSAPCSCGREETNTVGVSAVASAAARQGAGTDLRASAPAAASTRAPDSETSTGEVYDLLSRGLDGVPCGDSGNLPKPIQVRDGTGRDGTGPDKQTLVAPDVGSASAGDDVSLSGGLDREVDEILAFWVETMGKPGVAVSDRTAAGRKRRSIVRSRLREPGYNVAALKAAIRGCKASPWHQGDNDRGQRYDDLTLICRPDKIDRFVELGRPDASGRASQRPADGMRPHPAAGIAQKWGVPPPKIQAVSFEEAAVLLEREYDERDAALAAKKEAAGA